VTTAGVVFDIRRFSIHDGPGIRTAVFLKGCPLRCAWCHNPEGLSAAPELVWRGERCTRCGTCMARCPEDALAWEGDAPVLDGTRCTLCGECADACYAEAREVLGREMTVEQVLAAAQRDRPFYEESGGGVTFTGGEPLAQADFLMELLRGCKAIGLHTVLDTCGYAPRDAVDLVRPHVDLFLYDLKLMDDERHRRATGVSNALVLDNARALARAGARLHVRFPLVPGVNDDDDNVRATGAFVAGLDGMPQVTVLPYHRLGADKYRRLGRDFAMGEVAAPGAERLRAVGDLLRGYGLRVDVEG
jgi:pyruvate formate lyase activating enzyme